MWMSLEEYKKRPELTCYEDWYKIVIYIREVANFEDYDEAIDYIVANHLRNPDEIIQANAVQSLTYIASRFGDIKDVVLMLLSENLTSPNGDIRGHTLEILGDIAHVIPRLKQAVHRIFFASKIDFFTYKQLEVYTNKSDINNCTTIKEKEEFILSFCANSSSYEDIWDLCLSILKDSDNEELTDVVFKGLIYLVMRFERIDFEKLMIAIERYLNMEFGVEQIYAKGLLYDIAAVIPPLRERCLQLLGPWYREEVRWDWQEAA